MIGLTLYGLMNQTFNYSVLPRLHMSEEYLVTGSCQSALCQMLSMVVVTRWCRAVSVLKEWAF